MREADFSPLLLPIPPRESGYKSQCNSVRQLPKSVREITWEMRNTLLQFRGDSHNEPPDLFYFKRVKPFVDLLENLRKAIEIKLEPHIESAELVYQSLKLKADQKFKSCNHPVYLLKDFQDATEAIFEFVKDEENGYKNLKAFLKPRNNESWSSMMRRVDNVFVRLLEEVKNYSKEMEKTLRIWEGFWMAFEAEALGIIMQIIKNYFNNMCMGFFLIAAATPGKFLVGAIAGLVLGGVTFPITYTADEIEQILAIFVTKILIFFLKKSKKKEKATNYAYMIIGYLNWPEEDFGKCPVKLQADIISRLNLN